MPESLANDIREESEYLEKIIEENGLSYMGTDPLEDAQLQYKHY